MADGQATVLLRHLRQLAKPHSFTQASDRELLRHFATHHDEAAFTALVRRHGPLVLRVCQRVLHHRQDAEDAFQATFLLLARKATSAHWHESVANWLYGVAHHVALKARAAAARRAAHESRARSLPAADPLAEITLRELQGVLAEELARLPAKYRAPLILCCLEGTARDEAAQQLGWTLQTVKSRLEYGRELLRARLARRGLTLGAALAGTTLTQGNAPALSAALVKSTGKAAGLLAAGKTAAGVFSAEVASLMEGMSKTLGPSKVRLAAVFLLVAGIVAAGAGALTRRETAAQPVRTPQETPKPPAKAPPVANEKADKPAREAAGDHQGDSVTVRGRVLDPDGKPFAGAKLYLWLDYNVEKAIPPKVRATSGPDGRFRFAFAKQDIADIEEHWVNARAEPWRWAKLIAGARGYGCGWADIGREEKREMILRLVPDDVPVKGRVLDLQGRPVVGARVWLKNIESWYRPNWEGLPGTLTTDKDGRFVLTGVGRERKLTLGIAGPAIERKSVELAAKPPAGGKPADGVNVEVVVGPTKPVEGIVRARDTGKPLAGVEVFGVPGTSNGMIQDHQGVRAMTDAGGRYRLLGLPKAGQYDVLVFPKPGRQGYLSSSKLVATSEGLKPLTVDFDLRRGVSVRFRLIDKETRRVVRGNVQYTPAKTNPLWPEAVAPYHPGLILPPRVWFPGYTSDKDGFIQFVAYPGHGAIFAHAGWGTHPFLKARLDPEDAKKGYHPLSKGEPNNGFLDIVDGYRVIDTDKTDEPLTFDIELTRGRTLKGTLVGPDAKPITGAAAYGITFDASALRPDTLQQTPLEQQVLKTDAFTALGHYPREQRTLSFGHKDCKLVGYVVVNGTEDGPLTVRLEAWGALTGRVVDERGRPVAGALLRLHYPELPRPGLLWRDLEFRADAHGRFRVECLLPRQEHGLSVAGDAKRQLTPAAPEKLQKLSVPAGGVKDLGDVIVKTTPVKKAQ
jgi:RNA polymerase sigma factor (sigma-70 family)